MKITRILWYSSFLHFKSRFVLQTLWGCIREYTYKINDITKRIGSNSRGNFTQVFKNCLMNLYVSEGLTYFYQFSLKRVALSCITVTSLKVGLGVTERGVVLSGGGVESSSKEMIHETLKWRGSEMRGTDPLTYHMCQPPREYVW